MNFCLIRYAIKYELCYSFIPKTECKIMETEEKIGVILNGVWNDIHLLSVDTDSFLLRLGGGSSLRSGCRQRVHGGSGSSSRSNRHLIDDSRGRSIDVNLEFVLARPHHPGWKGVVVVEVGTVGRSVHRSGWEEAVDFVVDVVRGSMVVVAVVDPISLIHLMKLGNWKILKLNFNEERNGVTTYSKQKHHN